MASTPDVYRLSKGGNVALKDLGAHLSSLTIHLDSRPSAGHTFEPDVSVLLLNDSGRVRSDDDFVFYNQPTALGGAVHLRNKLRLEENPAKSEAWSSDVIRLELDDVPDEVATIVACASLDLSTRSTFGDAAGVRMRIQRAADAVDLVIYDIDGLTDELALLFAEFYRRDGGWKVRAVGQGYADGLPALVAAHGVQLNGPTVSAPHAEAIPMLPGPGDLRGSAVAVPFNSPAAWHPDPAGRNEFRYWDGSAWTAHVSTRGATGIDPLTDPSAEHASALVSPLASHPTGGGGPDETKKGFLARAADERRARLAGRDEFQQIAISAALGDADALAALPKEIGRARSLYRGAKLDKVLWQTLAFAVRAVLEDDVVTAEEEEHLDRVATALGMPLADLESRDRLLFEELTIARINSGKLPHLPSPSLLLRRAERAYAQFPVSLMKEVAIRQYQSGSSSVSIPLGAGIRYRVGGTRGRSVVIGHELVAADTGVLVVTSQRTVFTGQKKTLEFRNDKLVGLEQFADGLRLNVSNRQTASLFKLAPSPSIAAALITASVARSA